MQDDSTAAVAGSRVAAICRRELVVMYIMHMARSDGPADGEGWPLSKVLLQLSTDLDAAALARVLAEVPLWHLVYAAPSLCSAAVEAHSLNQGQDVHFDRCFVEEIADDGEAQEGNDDVAEEQDAAAAHEPEANHPAQPWPHFFAFGLKGLPPATASLSLACNCLHACDMAALAGVFAKLQSLTHLDISCNPIGAEGLCTLLPGMHLTASESQPDEYGHWRG